MRFRGVYWGWERASKEFRFVYRKAFSGFEIPCSDFMVGSKTSVCGPTQISACDAYCCTGGAGIVELSPLELAIISNKTQKAPSEFIDYGEIMSLWALKRPTEVLPLFAMKIDKGTGRCVFNRPDNSCGIYESRPTACRVYPYSSHFGGLLQRKACAGYKRGPRASKSDVDSISELTRIVSVTAGLTFEVNCEDLENQRYTKIFKETLHKLGLDYDTPVSYFNLEQIYQNLEKISDINKRMERAGLSKERLLGYICTEMKSPQLVIPVPDSELKSIQPVYQPVIASEIEVLQQSIQTLKPNVIRDETTQPTRPLLHEKPDLQEKGIQV